MQEKGRGIPVDSNILCDYLYFSSENRENAQRLPSFLPVRPCIWARMPENAGTLVNIMKNLPNLPAFLLIFVRYAFIMGISG